MKASPVGGSLRSSSGQFESPHLWQDLRLKPDDEPVGLLCLYDPWLLTACGASRVRSQSERGLDLAESPPKGGGEARASGKSGAARSDRRETSGGAVAERWRTISCTTGKVTYQTGILDGRASLMGVSV